MNLKLIHLWGVYELPGTEERHLLSHRVRQLPDGTLQPGVGTAPRTATVRKLLRDVLERQKADASGKPLALRCEGLVPDRLLFFDADTTATSMVWYVPMQKRMLYFTNNLGIPDGQAWVPPMLFAVKHGALRVLALREDKKPALGTPLCVPPFSNTSETGFCRGSAVLRNELLGTVEGFMEAYEGMYFNSRFSHSLTENDRHIADGSVNALWTRQIRTGAPFPLERLLPSAKGLTLADVLDDVRGEVRR